MTSLALLLTLALPAIAADVPDWIIVGILRVESRSSLTPDGRVIYRDKRRGKDGEVGCMQVTPIAFKQVRRRGEQFWMMEQDTAFSVEIGCRYLSYWYERTGSWERAVAMYNPRDRGYFNKVKGIR